MGSYLTFVLTLMKLTLWMLSQRYRNHIGNTIMQIEEAKRGDELGNNRSSVGGMAL